MSSSYRFEEGGGGAGKGASSESGLCTRIVLANILGHNHSQSPYLHTPGEAQQGGGGVGQLPPPPQQKYWGVIAPPIKPWQLNLSMGGLCTVN